MTRLPAARPYLTTEAVSPHPWHVSVAGDARDPSKPIDGWDYLTALEVSCHVEIDVDQVWEDCSLPHYSDAVSLVALWHSRATGVREVGARAPVWDVNNIDLTFDVPSSQIAERLTLTRQLVINVDFDCDDPLVPSKAGAILWTEGVRDRTSLLLEGDAARFPTELADFTGTPRDGAAWFLDLATENLDDSPLNTMLLWANADHPAIRAMRQAPNGSAARQVASTMEWDVGRQMIQAALESEEFRQRWGQFDQDTLGGTLELLIRRVLPGEDPAALRSLSVTRPSLFEARLQAAFRLLRNE